MNTANTYSFSPMLYIQSGTSNVEFYTDAFDAVEINRWTNDDGSIHAAELSINGNLFHLHEDNAKPGLASPEKHNTTAVIIGLWATDVDAVMSKAIAAGAILLSPTQSYDYGYRQGEVKDPFGHVWCIQKKL